MTDVRLAHGRIAEIARDISGGPYFEGRGGALLPGLHDHHIHLNATAAAMNSVRCGPSEVNTKDELIAALKGEGWLRGVGYHHSVAGEIDRDWLDTHGPKRPIRIQHRSGRMWILNSLAIKALGVEETSDGRLLDQDVNMGSRIGFPGLDPLVQKLLSWGVTGVTDVTPSNGISERDNYLQNVAPLKLAIMGNADLPSGHLKLHYHDYNLPSLEGLTAEIKAAHDRNRPVAAHCVTRAELMLTLAAIEEAGVYADDRIEHAAIADAAAIAWMKRLGVIVVTQPNFIAERAEAYIKDVPKYDHENLWRLKSFQEAGLRLAAGSDAPFGDPNPWAAMAAAVNRPAGFEAESIAPEAALALYTKPADDAGAPPRSVAVGESANICLLDRPWTRARDNLVNVSVRATWIDGELLYNRVDEAPL